VRAMRPLLVAVAIAAVATPPAAAAPPRVFPSDQLTVEDASQLTGRRLQLPLGDCDRRPSDCEDVRLVNELDGFDLDPRIEIAFDRAIDPKAAGEKVRLERASDGRSIALNRFVWSPARRTLFGQPREQLEEGTRYRVVVDAALTGEGARSEFTTMSASAGLRQMRAQLDDGSAYDAAGIGAGDRGLRFVRPDGTRTVFSAPTVARIQRFDDVGAPELVGSLVPNSAVADAGLYAFGSFLSPSWLTAERVIPGSPTGGRGAAVRGREEVGFTLIVPAGARPADGWPVAIFGPGITRSKYDLFLAADENAQRGIATISLDPVGHGFGPRSEAAVDLVGPPRTVRFSGFGRGRDLNRDGRITEQEGVQAPDQPHPVASVGLRDGLRQTAADVMALVRAVSRGADVDGDGSVDLRRTGVMLYAQSLGGIYGTMVMGVDPQVQVGVLNVPGGPILEIARLAPGFRNRVTAQLRDRRPSLLNGGREGFTESTPLFVDPPVAAPAQGAVAIQDVGARANWIQRAGSPEAFSPLIRKAPPRGSTPKRVIYQVAFGDRTVPNPTTATIVRAGGLLDRTSVYRNDRTPTASTDPHGFLLDPRVAGRNLGQRQVVDFLASDGQTTSDPDAGGSVFEVPIADPLSIERLNYALPPAQGEPGPERATGDDRGRGSAGRRPLLRISVTPRRLRAGRVVRVRIFVRSFRGRQRRVVAGVRVRLGGRTVRADRRGRVTVRFRARRAGRVVVTARRSGFRSGRAVLRVVGR
jgi:hypothetical protein